MAEITARLAQMQETLAMYNSIETDLETVSSSLMGVTENCESVWNGEACAIYTENTGKVLGKIEELRSNIERSKTALITAIRTYSALEEQNSSMVTEASNNFVMPEW